MQEGEPKNLPPFPARGLTFFYIIYTREEAGDVRALCLHIPAPAVSCLGWICYFLQVSTLHSKSLTKSYLSFP